MKTILSSSSLSVLIVLSAPAFVFAADNPSFWKRLAHNYGDPKNLLIGAGIGLVIGIFAMIGKKKK
jgi:uncharacterized protein YqgC (DUF456 family)